MKVNGHHIENPFVIGFGMIARNNHVKNHAQGLLNLKKKEVIEMSKQGYECIKCHKIKKGNTEQGMICAECYLIKPYLDFMRGN